MKKLKPKARRRSREIALQALYQWLVGGEDRLDIETQYLNQNNQSAFDVEYFQHLFREIPLSVSVLDESFAPFLDRPIGEISAIELSILRIATFEFLKQPDVPYKVVINEAIELAKKFGADKSHKFINGVVDKAARQLREIETR